MAASPSRFRTLSSQVALGALCVVLLNGCQLTKNQLTYDRAAEAERQEFRDAMAPVVLPPKDKDNTTPDFQSVVSTPADLKLPSPLVTVSVNRTVSLRDLLFELADQADVDLELDPQIRGSIIFSAKNRPFDQVVDRICEMSGLRYTLSKNNVLRIELDRPYSKSYNVDYLAATRSASSSIGTEISMSDAGGDTGADGGGKSSASLDTTVAGDTWKELSENLTQILTSSDTAVSLATMADPVAYTAPVMPSMGADGSVQPPALPGAPAASQAPTAGGAPTINIMNGAAEPFIANSPATFSVSKQTGIVTIFGNQRQQKLVEKFLNEFRKRSTTQVLIEAKVLQVDLNDEFAAGIDWDTFNITGLSYFNPSFGRPALDVAESGSFTGVLNFGSLDGAVSAMSRFGTVRALSSPRVTVINNQPAMVNVSHNNVYFDFDVEVETDDETDQKTITVDSEQKSVPDGVFLNVVPTANPDTGEVQLVVRPTISTITGSQLDPTIGLTLALNGVTDVDLPQNRIPEVSIQEVDSILKMQSGQMMVMGGLMKDTNTVEEQGVPVLSDIPFVGYAFKNHADHVEKSELVVLLKATIIPASRNADDTDKKIYEKFGEDRHPSRL